MSSASAVVLSGTTNDPRWEKVPLPRTFPQTLFKKTNKQSKQTSGQTTQYASIQILLKVLTQ